MGTYSFIIAAVCLLRLLLFMTVALLLLQILLLNVNLAHFHCLKRILVAFRCHSCAMKKETVAVITKYLLDVMFFAGIIVTVTLPWSVRLVIGPHALQTYYIVPDKAVIV